MSSTAEEEAASLPRSVEPRLPVELVPSTCWGSSLANRLGRGEWKRLRMMTLERAGNRCEGCGRQAAKLECHKVWSYDDQLGVQTLERLKALCWSCHGATHPGHRAAILGEKGFQDAQRQLMRVNGWDDAISDPYLLDRIEEHHRRSRRDWDCDLTLLATEYGVDPPATLDDGRGRVRRVIVRAG